MVMGIYFKEVKKMKRTIFGVILAALLVMSISFIAPVHVQAAKVNIKELKEDIGNLAVTIVGHEKFDEIKDNSQLLQIVEEVLESGATSDKVEDYLDTIQSLDGFQELCTQDIVEKAESINSTINQILSGSSDSEGENSNGFYIKINDDNSLSISKKYSPDSIYIDSEGNIKIPGHETIPSDIMDDIKDFLILLFLAGIGIAIGVLIVAGVFFILQTIFVAIAGGLGTVVTVVVGIALVFAAIAAVSAVITFIIDVIEFLTKSEDSKSKEKAIFRKRKTVFSERFMTFLNKLLSLFKLRMQNVFC